MAYINLPKKKRTYQRHGADRYVHQLYNTQTWRHLREAHLMLHPTCCRCAQQGVTSPATEVHHITPISSAGDNPLAMQQLAYDPQNLMSLCERCHHEMHNAMRRG